MKKKHQQPLYNELVANAFANTLKETLRFIATIPRDELRTYFERKALTDTNVIRHEIVSPLFYMRLERESGGLFSIRFGIQPIRDDAALNAVTAGFLRALFANTSKGTVDSNIEDCIHTDWFINCCNDMYEYIDLHNKRHTLEKVRYKKPITHRTRILETV